MSNSRRTTERLIAAVLTCFFGAWPLLVTATVRHALSAYLYNIKKDVDNSTTAPKDTTNETKRHGVFARKYSHNPLPDIVRERLLEVIGDLKREKASFVVKRKGGSVTVEEQGFDLIERFFADLYPLYGDELVATIEASKTGTTINLSLPHETTRHRVLDWSTYGPYALTESEGRKRLIVKDKLIRMSEAFDDLPLDLGDGWALLSKDGTGEIIEKAGRHPEHSMLTFKGPVQNLGNAWGFNAAGGEIVLPKGNPIAALWSNGLYGSYLLYPMADGAYRFGEKSGGPKSPTFYGEPKDYKGSWLLDIGDGGYVLLSKTNIGEVSEKIIEAPPEPTGDFLVAQTKSCSRFFDLSHPSKTSIPIAKIRTKTEHYWEVEIDENGRFYGLISLKQPLEKMGDLIAWPERIDGNGILGRRIGDELTIYNGLDPALQSQAFAKGPWEFGGAWLAKTDQYYFLIAKDQPEKFSNFTVKKPKDYGRVAMLSDLGSSYFVSKLDPTQTSISFTRLLEPKVRLGGLFDKLTETTLPEWVLVEDPKRNEVWISTYDLSHRERSADDGPNGPALSADKPRQ